MHVKRVTSHAVVVFFLCFVALLGKGCISPVLAEDLPPREVLYGYQQATQDQQNYWNAIQDCSTPSLECLVHNVATFMTYESIFGIMGPEGTSSVKNGGAYPAGSSLESPSNVADGGGGVVGNLNSLIASMYSHPAASTGNYIADVLESAHIVEPAYAQGLGFAALDPVLDLWKTFRNIAYIFFVLLFVIIGFMIMFRQKMGQTAITAQQAVPKIIIALIMVTFSYAIAGFAIDLMYLSMTLILGVFSSAMPNGDLVLGYNILDLMGTLVKGVANFGNNIDLVSGIIEGFGAGEALGNFVGIVGGSLFTAILALAILIGTIRLFFELLRDYASIVLAVVMAPMILMLDAIPGQNKFMGWIKTLVGNLVAFPLVLLVVVMFYIFTEGTVRATGGFMPPFLLGNGQSGNITHIMGLAIILALPDIVKSIREKIAGKDGFTSMISGGATKSLKDSLRYSPVVAGGAGFAVGAGEGVYRQRQKILSDPWGTLKSAKAFGGARAIQSAGAARGLSRNVEQITEGKAIDPNAWENTLVAEQRRTQKSSLQKRIAAIKASAASPDKFTTPPP